MRACAIHAISGLRKQICFFIAFSICPELPESNSMADLKYYHYDFKAMGSPYSIQFYAGSTKKAKRAAKVIMDDVYRLEAKYSRYRADSYLSMTTLAARFAFLALPA